MDVNELIAELRSTIEAARSMPMSASAVVNRAEVLELIGQLETALPEAFAASNRVASDRDAVVADAQRQAEQIVADARLERDRLVSETEVYRVGQDEVERLRSDALSESEALRQETDEYVDSRLANLEITLTKTLEAVTRGRDRLHGRSHFHALEPSENSADEPAAVADEQDAHGVPGVPARPLPAAEPGPANPSPAGA